MPTWIWWVEIIRSRYAVNAVQHLDVSCMDPKSMRERRPSRYCQKRVQPIATGSRWCASADRLKAVRGTDLTIHEWTATTAGHLPPVMSRRPLMEMWSWRLKTVQCVVMYSIHNTICSPLYLISLVWATSSSSLSASQVACEIKFFLNSLLGGVAFSFFTHWLLFALHFGFQVTQFECRVSQHKRNIYFVGKWNRKNCVGAHGAFAFFILHSYISRTQSNALSVLIGWCWTGMESNSQSKLLSQCSPERNDDWY